MVRRVLIVGPSGAGKSVTNNNITKLKPAKTQEEEEDPNKGLRVSAKLESCSDRILAKGPVDVPTRDGPMSLVLVDTPGVPDTQGRGVQFLDNILSYVKENPVHGMVFVVDAGGWQSFEMELCMKALKECFNGMLSISRLIIYVNKLPTDFEFEETDPDIDDEGMRKIRQEKVHTMRQFLAKNLLQEEDAEKFAMTAWNLQNSRDGADQLKAAIRQLPEETMNAKEFRTWTECKDYYDEMLADAVSAEECAEKEIQNLQARKEEIHNDIAWHERRIRDLTIAMQAIAAVATAVVSTSVVGMEIALKDSEAKLPALKERELSTDQEIEHIRANLDEHLKKEKDRCATLKKEFDDLAAGGGRQCWGCSPMRHPPAITNNVSCLQRGPMLSQKLF